MINLFSNFLRLLSRDLIAQINIYRKDLLKKSVNRTSDKQSRDCAGDFLYFYYSKLLSRI